MKRLAILLLAIALAGCTTKTDHGKCVGVNGKKDPALVYEYSGWNIALAIIFVETIFVPIVVALNDLECPVGRVPEVAK